MPSLLLASSPYNFELPHANSTMCVHGASRRGPTPDPVPPSILGNFKLQLDGFSRCIYVVYMACLAGYVTPSFESSPAPYLDDVDID